MKNNPQFYNYPKINTVSEYDTCIIKSLKYLTKKYPNCDIYKVGGENIKKGISDIDLLIVSDNKFEGNHLYLRNLPIRYIKNGILLHEFFAVDESTFKHINKLTSYTLQPLKYGKGKKLYPFNSTNKMHNFYKLTYYMIINYPMNFYLWENENKINVRKSLTKLKKLNNFEQLFKEVFKTERNILPEKFKEELNDLLENYMLQPVEVFNLRLYNLLKQAQLVCVEIFKFYEEFSSEYIQIKEDNYLTINGWKISFSDTWKSNLYDSTTFYAPRNLAVFSTMLQRIDKKFLKSISFSTPNVNIKEFEEAGNIMNDYLLFCEKSHLNQLIVDINFNIQGYNSFKYKFYQIMKNIKSSLKV